MPDPICLRRSITTWITLGLLGRRSLEPVQTVDLEILIENAAGGIKTAGLDLFLELIGDRERLNRLLRQILPDLGGRILDHMRGQDDDQFSPNGPSLFTPKESADQREISEDGDLLIGSFEITTDQTTDDDGVSVTNGHGRGGGSPFDDRRIEVGGDLKLLITELRDLGRDHHSHETLGVDRGRDPKNGTDLLGRHGGVLGSLLEGLHRFRQSKRLTDLNVALFVVGHRDRRIRKKLETALGLDRGEGETQIPRGDLEGC